MFPPQRGYTTELGRHIGPPKQQAPRKRRDIFNHARMQLMSGMKIVDKADLGVYYDADASFMNKAWLLKIGLTKDVFIAMFQNHPTIGFEADGRQFGGAMLIDNTVHFAVLPEYQRRWGSLLRSALAWAFSLRDPLVAKIPVANKVSVEWVRRQGWKCTAEDAAYVTFEGSWRDAPRSRFIRSLRERICAMREADDTRNLFVDGTDLSGPSLIINNCKTYGVE